MSANTPVDPKSKPILAVISANITSQTNSVRDLFKAGVHVQRRSELEETNEFRQVIPYVVLTHADSVLVYSRTKKGSESELFDKCSIGFGGHIDDEVEEYNVFTSAGFTSAIVESMLRELHEEAGEAIDPLQCIESIVSNHGLLIQHDTPQDRHVGILCSIEVANPLDFVSCTGDESVADRHWVPINELWTNQKYVGLEAWSQEAAKILGKLAVK